MEENKNIVLEKYTVLSPSEVCVLHYERNQGNPIVRYTFDAVTKELIAVELIK